MLKKFLMGVVIAIVLGLVGGNILYKQYEKAQNINVDYNSYLLQLGIYDSYEEALKKVPKIGNYAIVESDNKYYVYLGISTKKDNAKKVANVFLDEDIDVAIKKTVIDNVEFMSNLEQYDVLLDNANSKEDIMSINEVILSSYEEMVLDN